METPSASDIFQELSSIEDEEDAKAVLLYIDKVYGGEDNFFDAVAEEMGKTKEEVVNMLKPESNAVDQSQEDLATQATAPVRGESRFTNMKFKPDPIPMAATPIRTVSPEDMNAQTQVNKQRGMAQSQAVAQAAQNVNTKEMYMAKGGFVKKKAELPPSKSTLDERMAKFKPGSMMGTIMKAVSASPAGKSIKPSKQDDAGYSTSVEDAIKQKELDARSIAKQKQMEEENARDVAFQDSDERIRKIGYADGGMVAMDEELKNSGELEYAEGGSLPMTTDEEQADDVPAMLSEGEFVIPAYAVKFYGVKYLQEMLDTAHAKMMEYEESGETDQEEAAESPEYEEEEQEDGLEMKAKGGFIKAKSAPKVGKLASMKGTNMPFKSTFKAPKSVDKPEKLRVPRGPNTMPYGLMAAAQEDNPKKDLLKFKKGGMVGRVKC